MISADEDKATSVDETYVLVVEDEPLIRLEVVDMFEAAGYTVFEAGSSAQALQVMCNMPDVHVLFIDNDLQGKASGLDLANEIARRFLEAADLSLVARRRTFTDTRSVRRYGEARTNRFQGQIRHDRFHGHCPGPAPPAQLHRAAVEPIPA